MNLKKEDTKRLQGIAILMMLGLHLFNRIDYESYYTLHLYIGNMPLLTCVSYIFDACLPIYLFCSGYGLYTKWSNNTGTDKENIWMVAKLLIRFWIILSLTCIIGFGLGMREQYPGSFLEFLLNAFLLKNSYVGSFWFMQTYVVLVFFSKYIFQYMRTHNTIGIIMISLIIYVISFLAEYRMLVLFSSGCLYSLVHSVILVSRSQFSFVIGAIFAKSGSIYESRLIKHILNSKLAVWTIAIITVALRGMVFRHVVYSPFSAILLIILFCKYNWCPYISKLLLFFGRESTNMWLVHMQFYMLFTPNLVFGSRNIFVIYLTLVGLSIGASYIIKLLYHPIESNIKLRLNNRNQLTVQSTIENQ